MSFCGIIPKGEEQFEGVNPLIMVPNFKLPFEDVYPDHSCAINARLMMLCTMFLLDKNEFDRITQSCENCDTFAADLTFLEYAQEYVDACARGAGKDERKEIYLRFAELYLSKDIKNSIFHDPLNDYDFGDDSLLYQCMQFEKDPDLPIEPETLVPVIDRCTTEYPDCKYFIVTACSKIDGSYVGHEFLLVKRANGSKGEWIRFDDCCNATGEIIPY